MLVTDQMRSAHTVGILFGENFPRRKRRRSNDIRVSDNRRRIAVPSLNRVRVADRIHLYEKDVRFGFTTRDFTDRARNHGPVKSPFVSAYISMSRLGQESPPLPTCSRSRPNAVDLFRMIY